MTDLPSPPSAVTSAAMAEALAGSGGSGAAGAGGGEFHVLDPEAQGARLVLVQVVFRHGARTPLSSQAHLWEGVDWDVCGQAYQPGLLAARTTNVSRTRASLRGVLTGLYPELAEGPEGGPARQLVTTSSDVDEILYADRRSCPHLADFQAVAREQGKGGHDSTIMPLLSALGHDVTTWPPYMTSLAFELWELPPAPAPDTKGQDPAQHGSSAPSASPAPRYAVRVLRNLEELPLPHCPPGRLPSLATFRRDVVGPFLLAPADVEAACRVRVGHEGSLPQPKAKPAKAAA
ncbi:hypothetical protein GPECTOR_95g674 [Gonium pectorale]|uniref:Uncharacterized protein n=1 Tax=Gonium pectorale TaxID=33097 RepID=A0A150G1C9_GONPE|nr:hypothetical protein GPECTOR_95g674 [Gonium pectorale]|eukprot:KXZ43285.1 hypothetical protein GPECTOR_95g674 [Gonium pectorale]